MERKYTYFVKYVFEIVQFNEVKDIQFSVRNIP